VLRYWERGGGLAGEVTAADIQMSRLFGGHMRPCSTVQPTSTTLLLLVLLLTRSLPACGSLHQHSSKHPIVQSIG
jgi:hypothetical protein